ncbi:hypothetical protein Cni_G11994 [Canna indica]|uniref:Uncharacterized protein n=1 Tax=Canna indica TaxID=4628 RepID=A0AAQ3K8M8_9LILI|nr:hypothetical protein Cni_G11994 [Canna indica]
MATGGDWVVVTSTKTAGLPYSAMVAHRALYGANRRRCGGGRKVSGAGEGKSVPSRLSKVSTAEDDAK